MNENHDPKNGEFSSGGGSGSGSHADQASFHRGQQAEHVEAAAAPPSRGTTTVGNYNIHDKDGNVVGWQRHSKDAKWAAERIGGKAVKVKAAAKSEPASSGHSIKMPDGTFAPMTKANIATATAHWHGKK